MELSLPQRINLLTYLPKEGKFETMVVLADIRKKISITQDEISEYEIVSKENSIQWNTKGIGAMLEIEFTGLEAKELSSIMKARSEEGKLTYDDLDLYKMFP